MFRGRSSHLRCLALAGFALLGAPQGRAEAERLWIWDLDGRATEAGVASREARVRVAPDEAASPSGGELLLVQARNFDPDLVEIDLGAGYRLQKKGRKTIVRVVRPEWARQLEAIATRGGRLESNGSAEAPLTADADGRGRLAVALGEDSAVTVTVLDGRGKVVRTFSASSTAAVRWRIDLGSAAEIAESRVRIQVDRGDAFAAVPAAGEGQPGLTAVTAAATVGWAWFNYTINYFDYPDLYYYVSGGPPSTCGELACYRNGSWLFSPNWLCTDSSGDATKGPWSWFSTPGNQTDEPCYIRWPNGDTTNNAFHVWDKNYAITYRDSPWGAPPTSYYGHATDAQWGAGFDFGGDCWADYQNVDTDLYWDPATGSYDKAYWLPIDCSTSRVDRWYITWSCPFPATGAHVSGDTYEWTTCCHDGDGGVCTVKPFKP